MTNYRWLFVHVWSKGSLVPFTNTLRYRLLLDGSQSTHPSTKLATPCLTSVISQEIVYYAQRHNLSELKMDIIKYLAIFNKCYKNALCTPRYFFAFEICAFDHNLKTIKPKKKVPKISLCLTKYSSGSKTMHNIISSPWPCFNCQGVWLELLQTAYAIH